MAGEHFPTFPEGLLVFEGGTIPIISVPVYSELD
jgi:hypothetical protein